MKFKIQLSKKVKKLKKSLNQKVYRSFHLTRKRDIKKVAKLSSCLVITKKSAKILRKNWKLFSLLALFYLIITVLLVGIASQDLYSTLSDTIDSTSEDFLVGIWGDVGKAGLLYLATITGSLSSELSDVQQLYAVIIVLYVWLTSVWLLRNIMAGRKVRLRDGLYNSGSPILATFLVSLLVIVQLLPLAIAIIGYSAAAATGLLDGGVETMLFWIAAGLLTILSIYWLTGTIFSLIVVTLPGMYPMQAVKAAKDLVDGRRVSVIGRLVWMAFTILLAWAVVLIPFIMLVNWLGSLWTIIANVPFIPILVTILGAFSIVWSSTYIYLLYREVVDSDSKSS